MPSLSLLIPAHNPRRDWLGRVLEALAAQTLPRDQWELILVDNASREPLGGSVDLAWHPAARVVREEKLGSSHARLRGVREARGELLVFVDDDNVLDHHFLARALDIQLDHPQLGVFGPALITAEFETEPPRHLRPYLWILAQRNEPAARFSDARHHNTCLPVGAGMCIRRSLALGYAQAIEGDELRLQFGRTGSGLLSCEDHDMATYAVHQGFAAGVFPELSLTHLIAARRLEEAYLLQLYEGNALSHAVLDRIWKNPPAPPAPLLARLKARFLRDRFGRQVLQAERQGRRRGIEMADQAGL